LRRCLKTYGVRYKVPETYGVRQTYYIHARGNINVRRTRAKGAHCTAEDHFPGTVIRQPAGLFAEVARAHVARWALAARPPRHAPDIVEDERHHHPVLPQRFQVGIIQLEVLPVGSRLVLGELLDDREQHLLVVFDMRGHDAEHPDAFEQSTQDRRPIQ
jgi:hypothetical protein